MQKGKSLIKTVQRLFKSLKDLFASATLVEAMLIALEHMQVNFVTVSSTGLRKFRRNTLSFPQDLPRFAERLQLMKNYGVRDRVNSSRGLGLDPRNPDREVRRATGATEEERARYAVDASGCLVFPARVLEVRKDGLLVLEYDGGGVGYEWSQNVTPRSTHDFTEIMGYKNIDMSRDVD